MDTCSVLFRTASTLDRNLHHAKEIAIWILKDDEIVIGAVPPGISSCPDLDESFDLAFLIGRVEVEMESASLARAPLRRLVQRHIGPVAFRIPQDHPAAFDRLSVHVVKSFLPEREHLVEFKTTDDDRADLQLFDHGCATYQRVLMSFRRALSVALSRAALVSRR